MADIDIDMIEEIIRKDEGKDRSVSLHSSQNGKRRRRSSGSNSRHKSGSRSKSKEKRRKRHRESKEPRRRSMSSHNSRDEDFSNKLQKQQEALQKQIEEAKRQAEEAQREDCTVQWIRVNLNADDRNIYEFFVRANVGKVRDVRLIKDPKTNKSKGVAYVEFYTPESVLLAMALSGQPLLGIPMIIQASQAEINRQAQATKYKQDLAKKKQSKDSTMKLYIGNILAMMTESEIRAIFSPFGEIELIEVPRDPHTGKNKGVAFVTFWRRKDAKIAMKEMDAYQIKDKVIEVREAKDNESDYFRDIAPDLDLDSKGYYLGSGRERQALIRELNRSKGETNDLISKQASLTAVSNCLLLNNMFDPKDIEQKSEPDFYQDIEYQVLDICEEVGKVDKVWVDQQSIGNVWVKFSKDSIKGAQKAQDMLNNRYFDSREIKASFVPEAIFNSKVPK